MKELVCLLEERSAREMLDGLLPRVLSPKVSYRLVPFEGKQDLERQLERRIRHYRNPSARFLVLRDQDSHPDCTVVKRNLLTICDRSGRRPDCVVRIACRELEAFYLADLAAVEGALVLRGLAQLQGQRKFRAPDGLECPSRELQTVTQNRYQKIAGSREIGKLLSLENCRSPSFRNLVSGIRRLEAQLLASAC